MITFGRHAPSIDGHFRGRYCRVLSHSRAGRKRGVLLLIALVMLTLFMLLGTTYIIVANRRKVCGSAGGWAGAATVNIARSAASTTLRTLLNGQPAGVGATPAQRKINVSSLLADKYGDCYEQAALVAAAPASVIIPIQTDANQNTRPRFFQIRTGPLQGLPASAFAGNPNRLGPYEGRILTIENSAEVNAVFRIVAASASPGGYAFIVHQVNPSVSLDFRNLKAGNTVTIQGREFTGDPQNAAVDVHESFDAPEGRNWYMAWLPTEAVLGPNQIPGDGDDPSDGYRYVIPSFHRPDKLLAEMKRNPGNFANSVWLDLTNPSLLRPAGKMSFDPTTQWAKFGVAPDPSLANYTPDHPNFTGSNVRLIGGQRYYFDPINGPWDVDNDGDGVPDSIWIDIGLDEVDINTKKCRPLVAVMVVDLDARANLNVHGTLGDAQFATSPRAVKPPPGVYYAGASLLADGVANQNPARVGAASGHGWGPAEINPRLLLNDSANAVMPRILRGSQNTGTQATPRGVKLPSIYAEGRYGDSAAGSGAFAPAPGRLDVADPSVEDAPAVSPRDASIPNVFGRSGALGAPVDPWGVMHVALDQLGQPFFSRPPASDSGVADATTLAWLSDQKDDPYDISVGRLAPKPGWTFDPKIGRLPIEFQDNLFIPVQLERILRMFDSDEDTLSPRLASLLGADAEIARVAATTESWDSAAVCVPLEAWKRLLEISDQGNRGLPSLVSWDLQMGLRMDVNRPFGDGIDNSPAGSPGRGIADEPGEFADEKTANVYGLAGTAYESMSLTNGRDANDDGVSDVADQDLARQLFARHLYVLARTLAPSIPAKEAAQWAVNTVDFRDGDSIITRFQYDKSFNPNAASPAWNAADPLDVVWGCERPEMLITEAVAWRNIDEKGTDAGSWRWSDTATGGLIIELYNPWTSLTNLTVTSASPELVRGAPVPAEFAADAAARYGASTSIDLAKLNPAGEPVFQIVAVVDGGAATTTKLADDPSWPRYPADQASIERIIHLGDPGTAAKRAALQRGKVEAGMNRCFMPRSGTNAATTLQPGQFAIVAGPQADGGGTLRHTIEQASSDATSGLVFDLTNFSDAEDKRMQPLTMSAGLAETITAPGRAATDRETGRAFPVDRAKGPVGALVCTVDPDNPASMLRMPVGPADSPNLTFVSNARYRLLLRRLANPLKAFDATSNPYICIDSLPVHDQGVIKNNQTDATKQAGVALMPVTSAERCAAQPLASKINNLWKTADGDVNLSASTYNGYAYCGRRNPANTLRASLGFLPATLKIPEPDDRDLPPFPWLTWLNRDFASVHELLLVPKSSPAALLREHTHQYPFDHLFFEYGSQADRNAKFGLLEFLQVPSRFMDAEQRVLPADAVAVSRAIEALNGRPLYLPPHNYLSHFREPGRVNLNTLSSSRVWDALNGGRPATPYEDEVRFDGAGNPQAFQPSEDWRLNTDPAQPTAFGSGNWALDPGEDESPPDDVLDRNDDANNDGRQTFGINRSLAASRRGWNLRGLDDTDPTDASIAGQFDRVLNREGVNADLLFAATSLDDSWFGYPFQSGWVAATKTYDRQLSLLTRQDEAGTNKPFLFTTDVAAKGPAGADRSGFPHDDPLRHPSFRYRALGRLSNLVTPRSNVFAVWVTVGFFESDNNSLGAEYGLDTGDAVRHKAFILIDRSLPVGYRPGVVLNSRETVLIDHLTN